MKINAFILLSLLVSAVDNQTANANSKEHLRALSDPAATSTCAHELSRQKKVNLRSSAHGDQRLLIIREQADKIVHRVEKIYSIPEVADPVIYTDANQAIDLRVADLVRRMSVSEKVRQLMNKAPKITRLGVPAYDYWNECLHGVARAGNATVFPQAIGLAALWDRDLMHTIADTIATEARAKNNEARSKNPNTARYYGLTFWTPNINIFRDPRWGRGQETYGEDPYLTGELGVAFITGLQGNDPDYYKVLACAKHFAVHSGPEKLRHSFDARPTKRDLYETYLPMFEAAVKHGKVGNVMSAYNAIDGIPAPAHSFLLSDLLRNQWGFEGHVVSDCQAIHDVWKNHRYTKDAVTASAICIKAGTDLNCGSTYAALKYAYRQHLVSEAELETALSRVLKARFQLGLFDPPEKCAYLNIPASANGLKSHGRLALTAAHKSIVLLKNNGILPLDPKSINTIAVIGPNAASKSSLLGNYHGNPSSYTHVLDGLKMAAGSSGVKITYAKGCPLALKPGTSYSVENYAGQKAIRRASKADVVVFVGGLNAKLEGEDMRKQAYHGFDRGDRAVIELPQPQRDLLKALAATGKPIVFINMSGSAIAMPWEHKKLDAIIQLWYPGQAGGTAAADVLFGRVNPAGRLPITFYRSTKDLPDFLDYSMANRTYRYFEGKPLYAFGHGLSYTRFHYANPKISAQTMTIDGAVEVQVDVKNTGSRSGEEVVQLYVRHLSSPVAQPRHSLAGFERILLKRGENKTVSLELPASALRYWSEQDEAYVIPSGEFEIQIGASSDDIRQRISCSIEEAAA